MRLVLPGKRRLRLLLRSLRLFLKCHQLPFYFARRFSVAFSLSSYSLGSTLRTHDSHFPFCRWFQITGSPDHQITRSLQTWLYRLAARCPSAVSGERVINDWLSRPDF